MAEFAPAFDAMILNEGGFVLHDVPGDKGGQTYAGIARNRWPDWAGWKGIDRGETPPTQLVRDFYKRNFWDVVQGDELPQAVARTLFDFAVNAGVGTAIKLAQLTLGLAADGALGPKTVEALKTVDSEMFKARYALAKLARYEAIVTRDASQRQFLLGWLRRTLKEAS